MDYNKSFCDSISGVKNIPITIFVKYLDYTNLFFLDSVMTLPKYINMVFQVACWHFNIFYPQKR